MSDLPLTAARAKLVREDCTTDAERLDSTPFSPKGIGPVLGSMLAMIAALAKCIEEIVEHEEAR